MTQPFLIGEGWIEVRDGDASARAMFERHYSAQRNLLRRRARRTKLIVGPGFKLVLIRADAASVCAWRKAIRDDGQTGVECTVYRREQGELASDLLRSAMAIVWDRWPGERLFTFVDPMLVKPTIRTGRPTWGHCFYLAGWRFAGISKKRFHILEATP
ncbi:hypothetical protein OSH11_11940 [Kaistia dalseonensis]|uniref:Uncharacterized protein n=1 Tax=Kaistia dalseonensis TaxID=410840 RepID=A0ABU0H8B2_9HYPH|nr:hypothetical protein [Kaistia dalseonensis]MCX5495420.1 hypothetical protein [Kaistia dalseonensis]MDQ0438010.1 hypothetical protein [Kaistia dalseonensis]